MSYFTKEELSCQHCGAYKFDEEFLKVLNNIREECGFAFVISSVLVATLSWSFSALASSIHSPFSRTLAISCATDC